MHLKLLMVIQIWLLSFLLLVLQYQDHNNLTLNITVNQDMEYHKVEFKD